MNETVGPLFYFFYLLLLFAALYAGLRVGVLVGRQQEYLRRSEPLLGVLKIIADSTVSPEPSKRAAHETIHKIAANNFRAYHPNPPES